jgi:hypothetical protein
MELKIETFLQSDLLSLDEQEKKKTLKSLTMMLDNPPGSV